MKLSKKHCNELLIFWGVLLEHLLQPTSALKPISLQPHGIRWHSINLPFTLESRHGTNLPVVAATAKSPPPRIFDPHARPNLLQDIKKVKPRHGTFYHADSTRLPPIKSTKRCCGYEAQPRHPWHVRSLTRFGTILTSHTAKKLTRHSTLISCTLISCTSTETIPPA